ncbi:unnamed protein product, partial [Ceratitis capitata]
MHIVIVIFIRVNNAKEPCNNNIAVIICVNEVIAQIVWLLLHRLLFCLLDCSAYSFACLLACLPACCHQICLFTSTPERQSSGVKHTIRRRGAAHAFELVIASSIHAGAGGDLCFAVCLSMSWQWAVLPCDRRDAI